MSPDGLFLATVVIMIVWSFIAWDRRHQTDDGDDYSPTPTHYDPPRVRRSPSLPPGSPKKRTFLNKIDKKSTLLRGRGVSLPLLRRKKPDLPPRRQKRGQGSDYFG